MGGTVTPIDWFRMVGPLADYMILAFVHLRWARLFGAYPDHHVLSAALLVG